MLLLSFRRLVSTAIACWELLAAAVLVGVAVSLYACGMSITHAGMLVYFGVLPWGLLLVSPLVGGLCAWVTRRWFVGAEGSGVPQAIAALRGDSTPGRELLGWRLLLGKIGISLVATAAGFPIGRQGPSIYLGAVIMHKLGAFLPQPNSAADMEAREREIIVIGSAAGLAAAFHTPLGGLVFALEQLLTRKKLHWRILAALAIAIFAAPAIPFVGSGGVVVPRVSSSLFQDGLFASIVLAGAVTGLAGGSFAWMLIYAMRWLPASLVQLRARRPAVFGALCGLLVAVMAMTTSGTSLLGVEQVVSGILEGRAASSGDPLARGLALLATCVAGIPGGIFVPSLAIGAGIGGLLHEFVGAVDIRVLLAISMAGYFAAVTRSPLTACVVVAELSGSLQILLPALATCLIAGWVSRNLAPPLYHALSIPYGNVPGVVGCLGTRTWTL